MTPSAVDEREGVLFDKVGGWLIIPAFIHPIFAILGNIRGVYDVLQPYSDSLPFGTKVFLISVGLLGVAYAIAWLVSGYMAGSLNPSFPVFYIVLNVLSVIGPLIVLAVAVYYFKATANSEDYTDILKNFLGLLVWGSYMILSKRVKATFYGIPMPAQFTQQNVSSPLKQAVEERRASRENIAVEPADLSMVQRLGNVLYWAGCVFAALFVISGVVSAIIMSNSGNPSDIKGAPIVGLVVALCALIPWGIGRALRYILVGR